MYVYTDTYMHMVIFTERVFEGNQGQTEGVKGRENVAIIISKTKI